MDAIRCQKASKRTNIHIARQSLRLALLEQLGGHDAVKWGHQFDFKETEDGTVDLTFEVNGEVKSAKADLVVGRWYSGVQCGSLLATT
jgi:hypothetical protein